MQIPLLILGLLGLTTAVRDHAPIHRRYIEKRQDNSTQTPTTVPGYNFSMPVDHFNADDNRTYNNQFWVNDTYYELGGPIFLFDMGEAGVTDSAVDAELGETHGLTAIMEMAKAFHGMAIMWEHRYYGLSWPVPLVLNNGTAVTAATCQALADQCTLEPEGGAAGYQYLTVEQGLEDVAYFARNINIPGYSAEDNIILSAENSPWVFIGGSYPGARAAWVRVRNPEIWAASWASSAPTEALVDGSPYFGSIYRALPPSCAADITAVIKYVDEVLDGDHGADSLTYLQQLMFGLSQGMGIAASAALGNPPAGSSGPATAADLTGYVIGELLLAPLVDKFQNVPPVNTTNVLCQYIESYNPKGQPQNTTDVASKVLSNPGNRNGTVSGSIVGEYGVLEGLNAYAYASLKYLKRQAPDDATPTSDSKSWLWQTYSEFGFQQGSNPEHITIVSRYFNWTALLEDGRATTYTFGSEGVPALPDVEVLNRYGGWDMNVSNVMFTNGEFDPWRQFSVMSQQQAVFDAPLRKITQDVPKCNVAPAGTDVFGLLYPGAVHCSDLGESKRYPMNGTAPIQLGVALFEQALTEWLPCWYESNGNATASSPTG